MKIHFLKTLCVLLLVCMLLPLAVACKPASSGVTIGDNGNWFIDGVDSGVPAKGKDGTKVTIGPNGNWFLDGEDTGIAAAGKDGSNGSNGTSGTQVTIGPNGNWFLDGQDTGISAAGKNGTKVTIGQNGNWFLDGVDSGTPATGPAGPAGPAGPQGPAGADGAAGTLGTTITIGNNGNWILDGVDTGISAKGEDGKDGSDGTKVTIGQNGNWFLDGVDSGVPAKGQNGAPGTPGAPGKDGKDGTKITIGANGNWFLDGVDSGVPATGTLPPSTPDDGTDGDTYTPILRFAVASDLHTRGDSENFDTRERLAAFYTTAYAFAESQSYNKLDGIFVVGDYTQNGKPTTELAKYYDYVKANTKAGTISRAIIGNHEFYATASDRNSEEYKQLYPNGFYDYRYTPESIAGTHANYVQYSGYDSADDHFSINGYHFIIVAMDLYKKSSNEFYSTEKLAWLKGELQAAAAADPTGTKPIFVFEHIGAKNTVYGTGGADKNLGSVLDDFPQVVNFSGHSHYPLSDPRSIWQGDFTAINTGTLAYIGTDIVGHPNKASGRATNTTGGWASDGSESGLRTGGMYYLIEVDAKHAIRVYIYDLFSDKLYGEPIYVGNVGDPSTYTFTAERANTAEKPYFAADAALTVPAITSDAAMVMIPQAICKDSINNYRVELYYGNSLVKTEYRLACAFLGGSAPKYIYAPFTGLDAGKTYTVKAYAVSPWAKESAALTTTFKTPTSASAATGAHILSVKFNADGSATNAIDGATLMKTETAPTIKYDSTLKRNVATVNGNGAFVYGDLANWYELLKTSFTLETYVYFDAKPAGSYSDVVSAQQGGGFGFEYKNTNNEMQFLCHTGSTYERVGVTMTNGQWVHLAATFDGTSLKIYLNGVEKKSLTTEGHTMVLSSSLDAQYLVIGGDTVTGNIADNYMTGKIAGVELYAGALSANEILAHYNEY
ncbi:MAG: metallophosphoesterase [Clostridia bacterium]|nr:metallophosphoesterase [Clostridia bacterium]